MSGEAQAPEKEEGAECVYNVINVKTVTRTRVITESRQGAVQRIAQPVEGETDDDQQQSKRVCAGPPVCRAGSGHGEQAQHSEMVRVDPGGRTGSQPDQGPLFQAGEKALLDTPGLPKVEGLR